MDRASPLGGQTTRLLDATRNAYGTPSDSSPSGSQYDDEDSAGGTDKSQPFIQAAQQTEFHTLNAVLRRGFIERERDDAAPAVAVPPTAGRRINYSGSSSNSSTDSSPLFRRTVARGDAKGYLSDIPEAQESPEAEHFIAKHADQDEAQLNDEINKLGKAAPATENSFTPAQQQLATSITEYISGGSGSLRISNVDGEEIVLIPEEIGVEGPNDPNENMSARLAKLILVVTQNQTTTNRGRYLCNITNAALRQVLSVLIPTYLRQLLAWAIARRMDGYSDTTLTAISALIVSAPVLLNMAGLARDWYYKEDSDSSVMCRGFNAAVGIATLIAGGYTGMLKSLVPTLGSFGLYCMLRDLVQYFVVLRDGINEFHFAPAVGSALCYGGNQLLWNCMGQIFAERSGQGWKDLPYDQVAANDVLRAIFNWLGETMDITTLSSLQRLSDNNILAVKVEMSNSNERDPLKTATRIVPARMVLFFAVVVFSELFGTLDLGPMAMAIIGAGLLAIGYPALVGQAAGGYGEDADTGGIELR